MELAISNTKMQKKLIINNYLIIKCPPLAMAGGDKLISNHDFIKISRIIKIFILIFRNLKKISVQNKYPLPMRVEDE